MAVPVGSFLLGVCTGCLEPAVLIESGLLPTPLPTLDTLSCD